MNNKIFFSLMVFVFSPLIASEVMIFAKQPMTALIKINNESVERYNVQDVRKVDFCDLQVNSFYKYPEGVEKENIGGTLKLAVTPYSMEIQGSDKNQYVISFDGDSFVNLRKKLVKINKSEKNIGSSDRMFHVSLMDDQHAKKGVCFYFKEKQVEQIISMKKSSDMRSILAVFGVVGCVALVYTWIFILKAWRY
jgi:hypothetical protein